MSQANKILDKVKECSYCHWAVPQVFGIW